jgi:hypothetical protein
VARGKTAAPALDEPWFESPPDLDKSRLGGHVRIDAESSRRMPYLQIVLRRVPHVLFGLLVFGVFSTFAQQPIPLAPPGQEVVYDIPSQNLAEALNIYAAATGVQVLYETSLTSGLNSAAVRGSLTPEAALQTLLADTGLVGRRTDVDAITIFPEKRNRAAGESPVVPDSRFLGALQASILKALCNRAETRPGNYRMALQLWIAPYGAIRRAALLSSTGNAQRDAVLMEVLHNVAIGVLPPAGMSQPVTLAIVPRSPLQPPECVTQ